MNKETEKKVDATVEEAKVVTEEKVADEAVITKAAEEVQKEMLDMFKDNANINLAEAAIQNNEILFQCNGESYRVRKATYQEKQEANEFRMKKYITLLKDKDCVLEKDLIKIYKERGIDIEDMDKQMQELGKQQQSLLFDLGKAIKENKDKVELEKYKKEITNIMASVQGLSSERQRLLEFSLENRVVMEVYSYMIWAISEKKVGDKWVHIWAAQDDFLNATPDELLTLVTKNGALLITEELAIQNNII